MNSTEFIESIKTIENMALKGLEKMIIAPPGRKPSSELIMVSNFYNSLNNNDKSILMKLAEIASKQATNNILSIIDGIIAIKSTEKKGELELYFTKDDSKERLNPPDGAPLNEIYRSK